MSVSYTDQQIESFLRERKSLPKNWKSRFRVVPKRGRREKQLDITGRDGNRFRLIFRQSISNVLDFSVILALRKPRSNRLFRLRRYNGKSHKHTNQIEGDSFYDFHVHTATDRYQARGEDEDAYAEKTDLYDNFDDAVRCMFAETGFDVPFIRQADLFEEDRSDD